MVRYIKLFITTLKTESFMNYVDFPEFYALEELSEVYILLIKKGNMGPICLFQYASNPK